MNDLFESAKSSESLLANYIAAIHLLAEKNSYQTQKALYDAIINSSGTLNYRVFGKDSNEDRSFNEAAEQEFLHSWKLNDDLVNVVSANRFITATGDSWIVVYAVFVENHATIVTAIYTEGKAPKVDISNTGYKKNPLRIMPSGFFLVCSSVVLNSTIAARRKRMAEQTRGVPSMLDNPLPSPPSERCNFTTPSPICIQ